MSVGEAVRSPQFLILLATNFACCATHSGPIFHTVSYAMSCGLPAAAAVSIYSVEGFAGMFGRLGFGAARRPFRRQARRWWRACSCRRSARSPIRSVRELDGFYAVAALFGFTYAGVMPLYAVLARENFPLRMMGLVIGGSAWRAASAWRWGRCSAAGSTTPTPAMSGSTCCRSASGSAQR